MMSDGTLPIIRIGRAVRVQARELGVEAGELVGRLVGKRIAAVELHLGKVAVVDSTDTYRITQCMPFSHRG